MSYLVVVTFEIENAVPDDYLCIKEKLKNVGLHDSLVADDGRRYNLPTTTFAEKIEGSSADAIRDDICNQVKNVFGECGVKGKILVSVGEDWAWGIRYP